MVPAPTRAGTVLQMGRTGSTLVEPQPERNDLRLQDLIAIRKRDLRLDWAELATLATASGFPISEKRWYFWASDGWTNPPKVDVIRGMAAVLQVAETTVWEAAGVSAKVYTRTRHLGSNAEIMAAAFAQVPVDDQAMVIDMVQAAINARRPMGATDDAGGSS